MSTTNGCLRIYVQSTDLLSQNRFEKHSLPNLRKRYNEVISTLEED